MGVGPLPRATSTLPDRVTASRDRITLPDRVSASRDRIRIPK